MIFLEKSFLVNYFVDKTENHNKSANIMEKIKKIMRMQYKSNDNILKH